MIKEGRLVRPVNFESYKLLGEVDPIEEQPAFNGEGRAIFWEASKASPADVFARDAAEADRNFPRPEEMKGGQPIGQVDPLETRLSFAPSVSISPYLATCVRLGIHARKPVGRIFDLK